MTCLIKKNYVKAILVTLWLIGSDVFGQAESQFGEPNVLMGKAGTAGPSTLNAVALNPAHAGGLDSSEIQARWGFQSLDYSQRYPGFEAHSTHEQSLNPRLPFPVVAYKFTRRLGIAGIAIPFPVSQPINAKDIPIVILGQESKVNLVGDGQLSAYADLNIGYEMSPDFLLGVNLYYLSIKGTGDLIPSTSTAADKLASFSVKSDTLGFGTGFKMTIDNLSLGINTRVFEQVTQDTGFESSISVGEQSKGGDGSSSSVGTIFNPIRIGIGYELKATSGVLADVGYRRANKGQKRFSVVDFKEKDLDVYDTVSIYLGGYQKLRMNQTLMLGYLNEPGSVGPGSKGEDGKTGFGFFDLALNLGEPPNAPVWAVGGGGRFEFSRAPSKKKKADYRMSVEAGLVYAETSIGVDESGEQPGAYLARRYKVPLLFGYKF